MGVEQRGLRGRCRGRGSEVEAERPFLRHTYILAHQPARLGADRRAAGQEGNAEREQDFAGIGVGHDRPLRQAMRGRPVDRSGGRAGGKVEGEFGRRAGVAGITPIRMPTVGKAQAQGEANGLAGRGGVGVADQGRDHAAGDDGGGFTRDRRCRAEDREEKQQEADHELPGVDEGRTASLAHAVRPPLPHAGEASSGWAIRPFLPCGRSRRRGLPVPPASLRRRRTTACRRSG